MHSTSSALRRRGFDTRQLVLPNVKFSGESGSNIAVSSSHPFSHHHPHHNITNVHHITSYQSLNTPTPAYSSSLTYIDSLSSWTVIRLALSFVRLLFRPVRELVFFLSWLVWLFSSVTLGGGQFLIVSYSTLRIALCLGLYFCVVCGFRAHALFSLIYTRCLCFTQRHLARTELIQIKKQQLEQAKTLEKWQICALELDALCGHNQWKNEIESGDYDYRLLSHISRELIQFRVAADYRGLCFHLSNILSQRQFCNLHSEKLYSFSYHGTKYSIEDFLGSTVEQISFLTKTDFGKEFNTRMKLRFFQRVRRSLGKTVLCLSGGGAHAMFHAGVCKALVKGSCLPSIINGTSGGSIIAAFIGTRTDAELRDDAYFSPEICRMYGTHMRWLPSLRKQFNSFLKKRVLMDYRDFTRTAKAYYGSLTFEEAYHRTKRIVCITVTYGSRVSGLKSHPLVLNYITSPNVYIWSAVTCSCALPGLMEPQILYAKNVGVGGNAAGEVAGAVASSSATSTSSPTSADLSSTEIPWHPSGCEILDGSLQADIPSQRLTELFNSQTFLVAQTNPHVINFINDGTEGKGQSKEKGGVFKLLQFAEKFLQADIAHRLLRLAKLKIIPKIYGQDFGSVLTGQQKYTGDINIVPKIPFHMRFKILSNPTIEDMNEYFRGGESATYPKISRIQNIMLLERTLEECVRSLMKKMRTDEAMKVMKNAAKQRNNVGNGESSSVAVDGTPAAIPNSVDATIASSAPATTAATSVLPTNLPSSSNSSAPSKKSHPHQHHQQSHQSHNWTHSKQMGDPMMLEKQVQQQGQQQHVQWEYPATSSMMRSLSDGHATTGRTVAAHRADDESKVSGGEATLQQSSFLAPLPSALSSPPPRTLPPHPPRTLYSSTPTPHATVSGVILPASFDLASSVGARQRSWSYSSSEGHRHAAALTAADAGRHTRTPTSVVLAELPLHGSDDDTALSDSEGNGNGGGGSSSGTESPQQRNTRAEIDRQLQEVFDAQDAVSIASSASHHAAHVSTSSSQPQQQPHSASSSPLDSSASFHASLSSYELDRGYESDESADTTTSSYIDEDLMDDDELLMDGGSSSLGGRLNSASSNSLVQQQGVTPKMRSRAQSSQTLANMSSSNANGNAPIDAASSPSSRKATE